MFSIGDTPLFSRNTYAYDNPFKKKHSHESSKPYARLPKQRAKAELAKQYKPYHRLPKIRAKAEWLNFGNLQLNESQQKYAMANNGDQPMNCEHIFKIDIEAKPQKIIIIEDVLENINQCKHVGEFSDEIQNNMGNRMTTNQDYEAMSEENISAMDEDGDNVQNRTTSQIQQQHNMTNNGGKPVNCEPIFKIDEQQGEFSDKHQNNMDNPIKINQNNEAMSEENIAEINEDGDGKHYKNRTTSQRQQQYDITNNGDHQAGEYCEHIFKIEDEGNPEEINIFDEEPHQNELQGEFPDTNPNNMDNLVKTNQDNEAMSKQNISKTNKDEDGNDNMINYGDQTEKDIEGKREEIIIIYDEILENSNPTAYHGEFSGKSDTDQQYCDGNIQNDD